MNHTLVIRADGGWIQTDRGTHMIASGHLMRMLNIAKEWRNRERRVVLVTHRGCTGIESYLQRYRDARCELQVTQSDYCNSIQDADELSRIMNCLAACLVYLDGTHFTSEYQCAIRKAGVKVVVQDDSGLQSPYHADVIIGGHINAPEIEYEVTASTQRLLGTRFALIGEGIRRGKRAVPRVATHLLITLGGADAKQDSERCLSELLEMPNESEINQWLSALEIVVVVGASNSRGSHIASLAQGLCRERGCKVSIKTDLPSLGRLFGWSDIAFSAAGGTVLEMLCAGVPIALQTTHPIHLATAKALQKLGLCVWVGNSCDAQSISDCLPTPGSWKDPDNKIAEGIYDLAKDRETRRKFSVIGRRQVDGRGVLRICSELERQLRISTPSASSMGPPRPRCSSRTAKTYR